MILGEKDLSFEGLDVQDKTLKCKGGAKEETQKTGFVASTEGDAEIYQIRGYKPAKL